jgi:hypothetical protein
MNLALRSIFVHTCRWFITCRKILQHGNGGFISSPKEGVLRIVIDLKNPLHRLGLNPRTLGLMASTATTTSLRRLSLIQDSVRMNRIGKSYRARNKSPNNDANQTFCTKRIA